jgi:hypothetical protein
VRLEGDDPSALSILLDVSGSDADLMRDIDDVIAGLSPTYLHPSDHVSIYALDCSLTPSLHDLPADSTQLKDGVEAVLRGWNSRLKQTQATCTNAVHLWDALAVIVDNMSSLPGRRAILAVTDGRDKGSLSTWNELRASAAASGVAIFRMTHHESLPSYEDAFQLVCGRTGGLDSRQKKAKSRRNFSDSQQCFATATF